MIVVKLTIFNYSIYMTCGKRGRPPISSEKRNEVIRALSAVPNARQAAIKVGGVTPSTVERIAKESGIDLTKRGMRTAPEKQAQIKEALLGEPNARRVAIQVGGVSPFTVEKIAKAVRKSLNDRPSVTPIKEPKL